MLSKVIYRYIKSLVLAIFLFGMPGVGDTLYFISQAHAVQQDHVSPDYGDEDDDDDPCDGCEEEGEEEEGEIIDLDADPKEIKEKLRALEIEL